MIYGVGTDIVEISRVEQNLAKHGERFAERILTDVEMSRFTQHVKPAQFLAKRFAAKEAAAKAFGTGFRDGLSLHHIGVVNDEKGRPTLEFSGKAAELLEKFNINRSHLSLSDEPNYAIAFVIMECNPG